MQQEFGLAVKLFFIQFDLKWRLEYNKEIPVQFSVCSFTEFCLIYNLILSQIKKFKAAFLGVRQYLGLRHLCKETEGHKASKQKVIRPLIRRWNMIVRMGPRFSLPTVSLNDKGKHEWNIIASLPWSIITTLDQWVWKKSLSYSLLNHFPSKPWSRFIALSYENIFFYHHDHG